MKVALLGASGFIGSGLLAELRSRGHQVTALVANPGKLAPGDGLTVLAADVLDSGRLAAQLAGHDAVISAFSGHAQQDVRGYYMRGVDAIIAAVAQAGVPRLLMVGGAGSLNVAPGVQLVDTPDFPEQWKGSALGARDALERLRGEPALDWTMLSPAALIEPGERTGRFRVGGDDLLVDAEGNSRISLQDYAVAMIDELEHPAHARQRFCVAY
ncbi:NAD(P)-dependent oxidoreductase [Marilutibacter chinensis]|uniref:NAD(P)-dependent oxidoreductase n=1 Tax=Marilutibacter chinensis TaxID=2912247 RepID=A0ABS9HZU6_9GAMM|nr:NAD(P)-dependent oxidoreductase [Lysobacter chinensis]MCF7221779.1 NAD(P)-dependent oxidoreductase [Lysobacter chinensis]MCF7223715.1 NAD(P)-dependent oxidoreductase [Lysobacter chinensis]